MRSFITFSAILLAISSTALAQSLPSCASSCFSAAEDAVGCTSVECSCASYDFGVLAADCLLADCTDDETDEAVSAFEDECSSVGLSATATSGANLSDDVTATSSGVRATATQASTTSSPAKATGSSSSSNSNSPFSSSGAPALNIHAGWMGLPLSLAIAYGVVA